MKRRGFLGKSAVGAFACAAKVAAQDATKPTPPPTRPLTVTPPVVMAPRADGADVVWGVNCHCRGWVEIEEQGLTRRCASDEWGFVPQGTEAIHVRIDKMKAGDKIRYRTVTEAMNDSGLREESPWRELRALDPQAASTRFVFWNDTHQQRDTLRKLDEVTPKCDFLIWNGDTCNDWQQRELLMPTLLHPGDTDFTDGRPLVFVWGNHDVRGTWGFQVKKWIATPDGRPFRAFRSGPVAVVCLHTGEDKPDAHPSFKGRVAFENLRAQQTEWLRRELLERPELRDAPYRVVVCHIPLRWSDEQTNAGFDWFSKRSRDLWHDVLVKWGAQVVVSGHTHQAAWLPANRDFPYAQLTGGGPLPNAATWIEATADDQRLHFTVRKLDGSVACEASFGRA